MCKLKIGVLQLCSMFLNASVNFLFIYLFIFYFYVRMCVVHCSVACTSYLKKELLEEF